MISVRVGACQRVGLLALVSLALASGASQALQNIRIQVNNENLQNPPYLLEALKQASAIDAAASQQQAALGASDSAAPPDNRRLQAATKPEPIREEAIEALLDLEPESVLRLAPESIISSVSSHEANNHELRKAQLPVTSSHLKRPVVGAESGDDSAQASQLEQAALASKMNGTSAGAKSRVSPSVLTEEADAPSAVNLDKRLLGNQQPSESWRPAEPTSAGPAQGPAATVRRQYGHQTRTRITLGGGYQRDKLPQLAEPPASGAELGHDEPASADQSEQSGDEQGDERPLSSLLNEESSAEPAGAAGGGVIENSRLVEVPKRIVLPAGVFNQNAEPAPASQERRPAATAEAQQSAASSSNGRRRDSRCPANGVTSLEHPTACDKYFLCQNGQLSEQTCPNGLLYGTREVVRDHCVHRWQAVCGEKTIPNPISSPGCRWQNGIFSVQGSPKCVPDFYECKDGQFEVRKCSIGGQVYDDRTKTCRYAEQVGCAQEALADFTCPSDDQTNTYWPFPRYFLNERALIHCVNDKPEIIRCRDHERVDPEHLFCVPLNKSSAPELGEAPELTERRATTSSGAVVEQRERIVKPSEMPKAQQQQQPRRRR